MNATASAEASLRRAVDFIPQGLAVFDADLHLVASNARYIELQGLPPRLAEPGTPLYDIALYVARRGDMGDPLGLSTRFSSSPLATTACKSTDSH